MGKPSIFSREYEKRMKRRKNNIVLIFLVIVVVVSAVVVKFTYYPIDFGHIRQNMQAWIDSDSLDQDTQTAEENHDGIEGKQNVDQSSESESEEVKEEPEEGEMDILLANGKNAKAVYTEDENGDKVFTDLKDADEGVTFDISPAKKQMLVCDKNSVITLYNVNGESKVVSKDQYVSTNGGVFKKDAILSADPQYTWNINPKFVNEDNFVFVTSRPYFGTAAVNKYVWMTNITGGNDNILWQFKGKNVEIGNKEEKGIKVTVDGNIYYIGEDGNITA